MFKKTMLFVMFASSVLASNNHPDPFESIVKRCLSENPIRRDPRAIDNGIYFNTHHALCYYDQLKNIAELPVHLQTKQITVAMRLAVKIMQKIEATRNSEGLEASLWDHSIQKDAISHDQLCSEISDIYEFLAYQNAFKYRIYTEINLVELEQQRMQRVVKSSSKCTIC